ncbi:SGNH/GDSL hydrolase family protein [Spirosoma sp. 209]|uniref:SGNH/GDSL hydrolase family protein n=1 Tax=Spirosoma sp. 209 TaxID=1955701 RepID=UPI00098D1B95|nr:SGNH/GDSL hydrolase family protein [Spirosoma sp. 209]
MVKVYALVSVLFLLLGCAQSDEVIPDKTPFTPVKETEQSPLIVILGSSTASGVGASDYKHAWAGLFSAYLNKGKVINLARGGYTTYHILPDTDARPTNRPPSDTARSITAALRRHPSVLIISMTTNDVANGYSVDEIMENLRIIRATAFANGVKRVLITTSMPRRLNAWATARWIQQRDRTLATYPLEAVNFFDPLADPSDVFKDELTVDGIHPNDNGHKVLFDEMVKVFDPTPVYQPVDQ